MSKVALVFWSGTGHTEAIAELVAKGIEKAGGTVDKYWPWDFSPEKVNDYTHFAFGCPAMGDEQLETEDFEPMWESIKKSLAGKKAVLFGSYNWADGEWMANWAAEAAGLGIELVADSLPILDGPEPGSDEEAAAIALGEAIAKA